MILCFVLLGGAIALLALIPAYATIGIAAPILAIFARLTQGFALGGEVGANTAFLAEAAEERRRGLVVSWQAASQYTALILGSVIGIVLSALMPAALLQSVGWRLALLVGVIAVPFGYWMRRQVPETLQLQPPPAAAGPARTALESPLRTARRHVRVIVLGLVVLAAGTVGTYIFTYIVTYAQNTLQLPPRVGFIAELVSYVVAIPVTLWAGHLSDRFGRWPVNVWGNLSFLVAIYPVFVWVASTHSAAALVIGMTLLGVLSSCSSGFYAGLAEALPQSIRGSGFATVYSVSIAAFGGTTQLVVTWLIHVTGSALAPAWYLTAATAVGQLAYMLFPETAPVRVAPREAA